MLCNYIEKKNLNNFVIAAPDVGSAKRVEGFVHRLDVPMIIMDKRRRRDDDKAEIINIIGEVEGKDCFIIDDEVSTGGSMIEACKTLKKAGVKDLYAACTHGILCGNAVQQIDESPIKEFVTTNTIDQSRFANFEKLTVLNVAKLFGDAIAAIHMGTSVSKLFI
jgi:ribose-phosphate pyrophosphokinase